MEQQNNSQFDPEYKASYQRSHNEAQNLVEAMFNQVSIGGEAENTIINEHSVLADNDPELKGIMDGVSEFFISLVSENKLSSEKAATYLTGVDMCRILINLRRISGQEG